MRDLFFILDQGTTEHKIVIFKNDGMPAEFFSAKAPPLAKTPDGWGSNALDLANVSNGLIKTALNKYPNRFFAFGFANQGETVTAWDRATGKILSHAVSWQCHDAEPLIAAKTTHFDRIRSISGLKPSAYFSAAKMEKLLRENAAVKNAAQNNTLALGTLDTFMIALWTHGKTFITDPTTACRTQLYDTFSGNWSDTLLDLFQIKKEHLANVALNDGCDTLCNAGPFADQPLTLRASLCDQPAALIGHGGLDQDCLKATFGTGAFIDLACIANRDQATNDLLVSVAYHDHTVLRHYLEGGVLSFGSAIENFCANHPVTLNDALPFLSLEKFTENPAHQLARLLHERLDRVADVIANLSAARQIPTTLKVDGGLSQAKPLMDLLEKKTGLTVETADNPHVTAKGMAQVLLRNCN